MLVLLLLFYVMALVWVLVTGRGTDGMGGMLGKAGRVKPSKASTDILVAIKGGDWKERMTNIP